ncbi:carotenoid 1,2-hydratase [Alteromonas aestuariivivens]|uniref:Carotenoid 1,2-hydratase n=1 Tax=Alteromonas aestuariivivens TaxID=1938339 RepID=A0A3D8MF42_9ALTE|nr:lipocalin-like domain-containing protein [Alteromonas aestuariivivens]RDV29220.1 carotenoid 1,2-hydratase [Alteromonas aestuariivivens]
MKNHAVILLCLFMFSCKPADSPPPENSPIRSYDYAQVTLNRPLQLPQDHAAHPDYRLEWWYLTANLENESGQLFALQFTLFRFRNPTQRNSNWSDDQIWMAHVSLHNRDEHWFEQRLARGAVGNAGQTQNPFTLFVDDWNWVSDLPETPFPATLTVTLSDSVKFRARLITQGNYILHGNSGYSEKSANGKLRSYYYSQPFLQLSGQINLHGQTHQVNGPGWYDHEWTSHLMQAGANGWDWFSLHLDNGAKLMAFRMRMDDTNAHLSGTLITPDGTVLKLDQQSLQLTPKEFEQVNNKRLPTRWRLKVVEKDIDVELVRFKKNQWNEGVYPYYEGAISVSGSHSGQGFMELTGY